MRNGRERALLWLAESLAPAAQRRALAAIEEDGFFDRSSRDWIARGLTEKDARSLLDEKRRDGLEERFARMKAAGIGILTEIDAAFPYTLPAARHLPPILFWKGTPALWRKAGIAVVGTRKPSAYGREIARAIGQEAGLRGEIVVSGAATGIDTEAHEGALGAGGPTVAVLGCGLHHVYPPDAGPLLERIARQGAVVSQFPPDTRPLARHFPIRNAVIAALCRSVVIVEGASKSGSRYTADYARKMGVRLFAVPGEITRPQAALPNRLLAEGARAVLSPADPSDPLAAKEAIQADLPLGNSDKREEKRDLPELHHRILEAVHTGNGLADDLAAMKLCGPAELNQALLELELSGRIRQEPGRRYTPAESMGKIAATRKKGR